MSLRRQPLLPSLSCARECLPLGLFAGGDFLGLAAQDGAAVCDDCLAAVARREAPDRPRAPLRGDRRTGRRVACRFDEALDGLVRALDGLSRKDAHLVWIQADPYPRLTHLLGRRVCHMAPRATLVRRHSPREATGRLLQGLGGTVLRADFAGLEAAGRIIFWGCHPGRAPWPIEKNWRGAGGAATLWIDPVPPPPGREKMVALNPRPGTDQALALALMAGSRESAGPAPERAGARSRWSPGSAAEWTGLSGEKIEAALDFLNAPGPAVLVLGGGPAHHPGGAGAVLAVAELARHFQIPLLAPGPAPDPAGGIPDPLPAGELAESTLESWPARQDELDPEEAVVVLEGVEAAPPWAGFPGLASFLRRARHVALLAEGGSAPGWPADLVLPLALALETRECLGLPFRGRLIDGPGVFPPPRDHLDRWSLGHLLARRLGWPQDWFPGPENAPEPSPRPRFQVPRISPESLDPGEAGEGPVPTPARFDSFRLALLWTRPDPDSLPSGDGAPRLCIGSAEAAARSLAHGRKGLVYNEQGRLEVVIHLREGLCPGTVTLEWPPGADRSEGLALFPPQKGHPLTGDTFGVCPVEAQAKE